MTGKIPFYIAAVSALLALGGIAVGIFTAYGDETGFRDGLFDYVERHSVSPPSGEVRVDDEGGEGTEDDEGPLRYRAGDWSKYVIEERYSGAFSDGDGKHFKAGVGDDVNLVSYGSMKMNLLYGRSVFTSSKYRQFDEDRPVSKVITSGFYPERDLQLHVEGNVGKRLTLYIDHDSRKTDNHYVMKYKAVDEDEVIREINAGEVDIKLSNTKYVVFDESIQKGLGIDMTVKKNRLKVKAFGTVARGEAVVERFRGNSSGGYTSLQEYQFVRGRYYQLEPFKRYDNLDTPPSGAGSYNLVTFTSAPANPSNYMPFAVNIDPGSFELYIDDMDPHNNFNATSIPIDGGSYVRMASGVDYVVNYATGLITLLKNVPGNARIFAVYTLRGGNTATSDPAARTDVFPGKIFVYIKYGYSIDEDQNRNFVLDPGEDRNGDGKLNLDIYEVRSFYLIGERRILDENLRVDFYRENSLLTKDEAASSGRYTVDTSSGTLAFRLREPFRALLGAAGATIYGERQLSDAAQSSRYRLRINYYREARSFQLKNTNIVPDSVRIRINGREISKSLFSVDHTSGYLEFTDPNNPVIGPETDIEIRYEYLPYAGESQSFIAGVRADYDVGRNLNIGGTFVFSRGAGDSVIPKLGSEPEQLMIFEGDAKLYLNEKRLEELVNALPGVNKASVPFEITAYGEYARSYRDVNTFGKGLIDDMESGDEVIGVSLSERDWILSSPPVQMSLPFTPAQANRGILNYLYYRSLGSAETLRGLSYTPFAIDYSVKPGPYNVATGHLAESVQSQDSQRSLALDFDFSGGGEYVAVVTRRLSNQAVDFSGLQYVEIWYRSGGGTGTANLYLDIGRINEDSDGDGILDTEDLNNNGFLDSDPSADIFEDIGYAFNPAGGTATRVGSGPCLNSFTRGDGVLNSEDLNGNGILDTEESAVRLPGEISGPAPGTSIEVNMADTSWRVARIYIDRNSPAYAAQANLFQDILSRVEAVRLLVEKGTASSGVIYIDRLSFVSSRWRNIKVDGVPLDDPSILKVTVVDTFNDDEYRSDAFIFREAAFYKSLHGEKSDSQLEREKESALAIEYDVSSHASASVTRRFQGNIDLRFYRTLNIWFNFKEFTPGDMVSVTVGSSEQDYLEFVFPVEHSGIWREMTFRLQDGSRGYISPAGSSGSPDMKRINFIEIGVRGGSGRFWVNDIYASDSETLKDSAYWFEGEIRSKRALARTASGTPIISDLLVKYVVKGHGSQFGSIGKTVSDMSERYHQLFSSVKILPNWLASLDFTSEKSSTDSLNEEVHESRRGDTGRKSLCFETSYDSDIPLVPSVKLMYKHDRYDNSRDEFISACAFKEDKGISSKAPMIWIEENVKDFLGGSFVANIQLNTVFREEEIRRKSAQLSDTDLAQYVSPRESERRQKGSMRLSLEYQSRKFYFQPIIDIGSQEVVRLQGREGLADTTIHEDVDGCFHFPFLYRGDYRFVERNKNADIRVGFRDLGLVNPSAAMSMYYLENRFRDYGEAERLISGDFSRAKDARSYISTRIDIPLALERTGLPRVLRSLVLGFSRSVLFQETEIPYEGEGISEFSEEYGIRRAYGGISEGALNFFKYSPVHFLSGRGNFAGGRDFAYGTLNEGPRFQSGEAAANYGNNLRLIDTISLSGTASAGPVDITLTSGINNLCERQSVEGAPQQVVTFTANVGCSFDIMRAVDFGFFRPNRPGIPHHAATVGAGYGFSRNMIITANIREDVHSPNLGITFKRDRASLGVKGAVDFRTRQDREYIPVDPLERSRKDDIYAENLSNMVPFREEDRGYRFTAFFETDVEWVHGLFSHLYELTALPIFGLEYSLLFNRYDYSMTVSPEPYDQHLITGKLTLDLHRNVQGGILGRWALEKFRNRETNGVYREIMSYEAGLNFTLLF